MAIITNNTGITTSINHPTTWSGPKTIKSFIVKKCGDFFILKQIETFEHHSTLADAVEHVCRDEKEIVDYIQAMQVTERLEK
jgi:kynurenine formamidase